MDHLDYEPRPPERSPRKGPLVVLSLLVFCSAMLMLLILLGLGALRWPFGR